MHGLCIKGRFEFVFIPKKNTKFFIIFSQHVISNKSQLIRYNIYMNKFTDIDPGGSVKIVRHVIT